MNDITGGSELERPGHILGNQRAAEHRQCFGSPQGLDVRIMEGLVESFPQRQKRAIEGGIHDAEQQNGVTEPQP